MKTLTLIENADVYAPEHLGRRSLLLGAGRILWMGEGEPGVSGALLAERVDLSGSLLVPGLVDGHAHLLGGGCEAGPASSIHPLPAGRFLAAGVTTVVGVLGTDDLVRTPAQLAYAALGLREAGLSAWSYTGGYHLPPATVTGSVRGDIVHVDPVLGLGEVAVSDHRSSQPTLDELLRLASECHVAGLMSGKAGVVHLHLGSGERGLELVRRALDETELPARTWYPTHANRGARLFEEALALTGRGVTIDLTAAPDDETDELPARAAIERILDEDVSRERWTVSSDSGGSLPVFDEDGRVTAQGVGGPEVLLALLATLVERGRALQDVLPGFTSNVSEQLRLPRKGRISVGADADLLVLDPQGLALQRCWSRGHSPGS